MSDNSEELFPVVADDGSVIGSATRGECHSGSRLLHPVVHLHVFNSKGEVFLQRRPEWKDIQPGKWDTSVGGHIDYGETPEQALIREVREELGMTDFKPERVGMYVFESSRVTTGPIIAFLGFVLMAFAIIYRKKDHKELDDNTDTKE